MLINTYLSIITLNFNELSAPIKDTEWQAGYKIRAYNMLPTGFWQWHPTPVLLPGNSHGWRSLEGCSPWVLKSQTWLSDFTFTFHFHALEKEMPTHSSVLAWRIPGTEEPGGLPSMGSHRVGHNWSDLAAAAAETHFRVKETHRLK